MRPVRRTSRRLRRGHPHRFRPGRQRESAAAPRCRLPVPAPRAGRHASRGCASPAPYSQIRGVSIADMQGIRPEPRRCLWLLGLRPLAHDLTAGDRMGPAGRGPPGGHAPLEVSLSGHRRLPLRSRSRTSEPMRQTHVPHSEIPGRGGSPEVRRGQTLSLAYPTDYTDLVRVAGTRPPSQAGRPEADAGVSVSGKPPRSCPRGVLPSLTATMCCCVSDDVAEAMRTRRSALVVRNGDDPETPVSGSKRGSGRGVLSWRRCARRLACARSSSTRQLVAALERLDDVDGQAGGFD